MTSSGPSRCCSTLWSTSYDLSRGAPILLLCAARLELLEKHPDWGGGKVNSAIAQLGPLAARECEELIDQLPGELGFEARSPVIVGERRQSAVRR